MEPLLSVHVDDALREAARATTARLAPWGPTRTIVAPGWEPFADALNIESVSETDTSAVVVSIGPVATLLEQLAASADTGAIGFVMPAAFRRRFWQREPTRFLDPTRELWMADWSPLAIERIDVPGADARIEVVVGHARPTPTPLIGRRWLRARRSESS